MTKKKQLGIRPTTRRDIDIFIISDLDLKEAEALNIDVEERFYKNNDIKGWLTIYDIETGYPYALGGNTDWCVWFITSTLVSELTISKKREFLDLLIARKEALLKEYGCLTNLMWTGNKLHVHLLEKLGATFQDNKLEIKQFYIRE